MKIADLSRRLIGTTAVAARYGCSPKHVAHLARTGVLDSLDTPLGRLFLVEDVERLAQERAGMARDGRGHVRVTR